MHMHHMLEEGNRSPGTGGMAGYELLCWCWEPELCPMQEQPVLLAAELSLQPQHMHIKSLPVCMYVCEYTCYCVCLFRDKTKAEMCSALPSVMGFLVHLFLGGTPF